MNIVFLTLFLGGTAVCHGFLFPDQIPSSAASRTIEDQNPPAALLLPSRDSAQKSSSLILPSRDAAQKSSALILPSRDAAPESSQLVLLSRDEAPESSRLSFSSVMFSSGGSVTFREPVVDADDDDDDSLPLPATAKDAIVFGDADINQADVAERGGASGEFDCRSPLDVPGRCVSIRGCPGLQKLLVKLTRRKLDYLRKSVCRFEQQMPVMCCPRDEPDLDPPVTTVQSAAPTPTATATPAATTGSSNVPSTTAQAAETAEQATATGGSSATTAGSSGAVGGSSGSTDAVPTVATAESDSLTSTSDSDSPTSSSASAGLASTTTTDSGSTGSSEPSTVSPKDNATGSASSTSGGTPQSSAEGHKNDGDDDGGYRMPKPPNCGYRNVTGQRIVGGTESEIAAWPWLAALGYEDDVTGEIQFLCGGALITDRHVLTAAHCLYERDSFRSIRLGDHVLYNDTDVDTARDYNVSRTILHEDYNTQTFANDIAIIKLKKPVIFDYSRHTICLPLTDAMKDLSLDGKRPFIAGWGTIQYRGEASPVLLETQVRVVTNTRCAQRYTRFKQITITDRVLCAGSRGRDACQGDSGGPMMFPAPDGDYWYTIGVVSFGFRCADPRHPGVYTRISEYIDWILDNLN